MSSMTVKLSWNENELGSCWMNPDNFRMLLYSDVKTRSDLLQVKILDHSGIESECLN